MSDRIADRTMWIAIRAGILGMVRAIEIHTHGDPLAIAIRASLLVIADAIKQRWGLMS